MAVPAHCATEEEAAGLTALAGTLSSRVEDGTLDIADALARLCDDGDATPALPSAAPTAPSTGGQGPVAHGAPADRGWKAGRKGRKDYAEWDRYDADAEVVRVDGEPIQRSKGLGAELGAAAL